MAVDTRAIVVCSLGTVLQGELSLNHIQDKSGLVMATGSMELDGIITPAKGTAIQVAYICPQRGTATRFPRPLRVVRSMAQPFNRTSTIDIGCKLALMNERVEADSYKVLDHLPAWYTSLTTEQQAQVAPVIYSQDVVDYCLAKIGITLASGSQGLAFSFLREQIDLSGGYVKVIGDLIRSECCYGTLTMNEELLISRINMQTGSRGPVLRRANILTLEPITGGTEPAQHYRVRYDALERR